MHLDCQSFKAGLRKAKSQRFALIMSAQMLGMQRSDMW